MFALASASVFLFALMEGADFLSLFFSLFFFLKFLWLFPINIQCLTVSGYLVFLYLGVYRVFNGWTLPSDSTLWRTIFLKKKSSFSLDSECLSRRRRRQQLVPFGRYADRRHYADEEQLWRRRDWHSTSKTLDSTTGPPPRTFFCFFFFADWCWGSDWLGVSFPFYFFSNAILKKENVLRFSDHIPTNQVKLGKTR